MVVMKVLARSATILWLVMLLFTLGGCKTVEIRGQYIDDDTLSTIKNKKLTKSEIINLIGSPTLEPNYSQNIWYYIHRTTSYRAWFQPKIEEQKILKITFNQNEQVEKAEILTDNHQEELNLINEYTKTHGTELNGWQKFVKNIGRFNKTNSKTKKGRKK